MQVGSAIDFGNDWLETVAALARSTLEGGRRIAVGHPIQFYHAFGG